MKILKIEKCKDCSYVVKWNGFSHCDHQENYSAYLDINIIHPDCPLDDAVEINIKKLSEEELIQIMDRLLVERPDLIREPDPELIKLADELVEGVAVDDTPEPTRACPDCEKVTSQKRISETWYCNECGKEHDTISPLDDAPVNDFDKAVGAVFNEAWEIYKKERKNET